MGAAGTLLQTLRRVCLIRLPGGPNITISIVVSCEWNYSQRLQEDNLGTPLRSSPQDYAPGGHGELSLAIHHGIPQKVAQLETQGATYEGPMPLMT